VNKTHPRPSADAGNVTCCVFRRTFKPSANFIIIGQKENLSQNIECLMKRNWMKSVLGLNFLLKKSQHLAQEIEVSSLLCF
jgi:hypothetical protein